MDNIHPFTAQSDIEEQAADWLVRLDSERPPSGEELADLKQWINRSPAHRQEFQRLTQYWHSANILTELSFPLPGSQRPQSLWAKIKRRLSQSWPVTAAVGTAMAVSLSIGLVLLSPGLKGVSGNGIYETRIGEQNTITLVDGSVIQLNTQSQLQVNYLDNQRNVVLITGEAHFDVAKDSQRPFVVKAGQGSVRAVGTAFSVRLNQQALKVIVTEGKVALARAELKDSQQSSGLSSSALPRPDINQGYLVQGQAIDFEPQSHRSIDSQVQQLERKDIEQQLSWRKGLLLFSGEPLSQVISEVNRYTKLNIKIIDSEIADISIGGQFKVGETEAMLKVLEASFGINVTRPNQTTVHLTLQ